MSAPPSKKAQCLGELRRQVLTQELEPGTYLDETLLAEAHGLSRPPLREVLRELAGEGYVVLHPNRGAQVAPMTHKTLRNFFTVAPMVYAAVSRLAAEHARPEQVARLKTVQLEFRTAIRAGDVAERALTNERFHAIIGEMADNIYLAPSLRRLLIDHTRIGMTFFNAREPALSREREIAADQHDTLIALIEAGDADGAASLTVAHWELSRAQIERFVTPQGMHIPLGNVPDAVRQKGTP